MILKWYEAVTLIKLEIYDRALSEALKHNLIQIFNGEIATIEKLYVLADIHFDHNIA